MATVCCTTPMWWINSWGSMVTYQWTVRVQWLLISEQSGCNANHINNPTQKLLEWSTKGILPWQNYCLSGRESNHLPFKSNQISSFRGKQYKIALNPYKLNRYTLRNILFNDVVSHYQTLCLPAPDILPWWIPMPVVWHFNDSYSCVKLPFIS